MDRKTRPTRCFRFHVGPGPSKASWDPIPVAHLHQEISKGSAHRQAPEQGAPAEGRRPRSEDAPDALRVSRSEEVDELPSGEKGTGSGEGRRWEIRPLLLGDANKGRRPSWWRNIREGDDAFDEQQVSGVVLRPKWSTSNRLFFFDVPHHRPNSPHPTHRCPRTRHRCGSSLTEVGPPKPVGAARLHVHNASIPFDPLLLIGPTRLVVIRKPKDSQMMPLRRGEDAQERG